MYLVEEATIDTIKAIKAKSEQCPLDEYDVTQIVGRKDVKERMAVTHMLAEMNRDERHYFSCGFSPEEARELTSNGIPFEYYNDRKYGIFTIKGFKLLFLNPKLREEILRILPGEYLPAKSASVQSKRSAEVMASAPTQVSNPAVEVNSSSQPVSVPVPTPSVSALTQYMNFTTRRLGVRISAVNPELYSKLINAGPAFKRKN